MSNPEEWFNLKHKLIHFNTIMAVDTCEIQAVELKDIVEMAQLFYDEYITMFEDKIDLLRRSTILKLDAFKVCTE